MRRDEKVKRKSAVPPYLLAVLLGAAFGVALLAAWGQVRPAHLFRFDAERVSAVRIVTQDHAGYIQSRTVLDPGDRGRIREIVKLLNGFAYRSAEHRERKGPIGAGLSCVEVQMGAGYACVYFESNGDSPDFVQVWGPDGSATRYLAEPGYFQPLVDLIEKEAAEWDQKTIPEESPAPTP